MRPVAVAVAALALSACSGGTFGDPPDATGTARPAATAARTPAAASASAAGSAGTAAAALPDLVGKGLQAAQDLAQEAGFGELASHDALGRGREQLLDRNWKEVVSPCVSRAAAGNTSVERYVKVLALLRIGNGFEFRMRVSWA